MITPRKITFFVGVVLFILFLISLSFHKGEMIINDRISLKFPTIKDIFKPEKVEYADISKLILESEKLEANDSIRYTQSIKKTATNMLPKPSFDTIRADRSLLLKNTRRIEFPSNNQKVLLPFFKELARIKNVKKTMHVMHYGDSQIEGDRITSYLRDRLQKEFGGKGAGLLPVIQPYGQFSMKQDVSSNWKRYTIFGRVDTTLYHKRYGVLASFCRFTDPASKKKGSTHEAWIKLEESIMGYKTVKEYNRFKLFYGYNNKPFTAELYANNEMVDADFIPVANEVKMLEWRFDTAPSELTLKLTGDDSPDIYAMSFESNTGILVDNIPMRGSAGLEFTKMDKQLLKKMYEQLNVKLIILQFGGNVVPYVKNDCKFYGNSFYNQLIRLKSLVPGIPILVIGPADMSVKEKDYYVTYPTLKNVRDVLKEATFKAGYAYWDMFEAMGGENSMPSWVFADPPLATSDFVHFNHRGARLIAEMFYNALKYEYGLYVAGQGDKNLAVVE